MSQIFIIRQAAVVIDIRHEVVLPLVLINVEEGAQWLSDRVHDSRQKDREFEPQWCHCVVVLEQDTFILA